MLRVLEAVDRVVEIVPALQAGKVHPSPIPFLAKIGIAQSAKRRGFGRKAAVREINQRLRMKTIRRVAVLGAGTMGSRIAAHFANAGIPALLLDFVIPDQPYRNAAALRPGTDRRDPCQNWQLMHN